MNKSLPIIAVVLVAGIGLWWFLSGNASQNNVPANQENSTQTEDDAQTSATTIRALMAMNQPMTCEFSMPVEDKTASGKIYVHGQKARTDYDASAFGITGQGHMIADGQTAYIWYDGSAQGLKMTIPEETEASADAQTEIGGIDMNSELEYDCSPWRVDNGMFTPPRNVTFSAGLEGLMDFSSVFQTN